MPIQVSYINIKSYVQIQDRFHCIRHGADTLVLNSSVGGIKGEIAATAPSDTPMPKEVRADKISFAINHNLKA